MKKRVGGIKSKSQSRFPETSIQVLLETGTLDSMRNAKRATGKHLKYQWDYYAELARRHLAFVRIGRKRNNWVNNSVLISPECLPGAFSEHF